MATTPRTPFQSRQRPLRNGGVSITGIMIGLVLLLTIFFLGLTFSNAGLARTAARRLQASNNGRGIGLAMHNFMSFSGDQFPANIKDDDGNELLSWRLEVLPFLDGNKRELIDRQAAWNSPANKTHTEEAVPFFRSPRAAATSPPNATHFVAINDPKAPLYGVNVSFDSIKNSDGVDKTAIFLEYVDSDIAWAEPRDVTIAEAIRIIQGSPESGGTVVVFVDGSTGMVEPSASAEDITKLFLLGDGAPGNSIVF